MVLQALLTPRPLMFGGENRAIDTKDDCLSLNYLFQLIYCLAVVTNKSCGNWALNTTKTIKPQEIANRGLLSFVGCTLKEDQPMRIR